MFSTQLIAEETSEYRKFKSIDGAKKLAHVTPVTNLIKVNSSIHHNNHNSLKFSFNAGMFKLKTVNTIYLLEHLNDSRDLLLPENPKPLDWIVLLHSQDDTIVKLKSSKVKGIKIYAQGKRIMGYDEPLDCDIEFSILRLIFLNDLEGWVIG